MSRYFDYTQVVFHKTLVAFEEVLKNVVRDFLNRGSLDCSGAAIQRKIHNGEFASFDDHFMIEQLRRALSELNAPEDEPLKVKINAVLNRHPPKLVVSSERIRPRQQRAEHRNLVGQIKANLDRWAEKSGVEKDLWHVWERHLPMTKIGSLVPVSAIEQGGVEDEAAQGVRILTTDPDAATAAVDFWSTTITRLQNNSRSRLST